MSDKRKLTKEEKERILEEELNEEAEDFLDDVLPKNMEK